MSLWGPGGEESWVAMDDGCEVLVRKWSPSGPPCAALHICHGMGDHSARYGRFATFLTEHGFVVYAADHRSHGYTAMKAKEKNVKGHWLGHVEPSELGGKDLLQQVVADNLVLCNRESHDLPLVVLGHSMGSVLARLLAACRPKGLAGLVLVGAPAVPVPAVNAAFGPLLGALGQIYGDSGVAPLINKLTFEKFNSMFAPNKTDFDWINRDPAEVEKYASDSLCGFKTSVGFTKSLVNAINAAASKDVLSKLPAELPVLVLWGTRDPVTVNDFGTQSADQMEKQMKAAGKQLTKRIAYSGARHEVLLELCADEVMHDILSFIQRHVLKQLQRSRL